MQWPSEIQRWSEGYFSINASGHIVVKPDRKGEGGDLYALTQSLVQQGIDAPFLVRFNGILRDRIQLLSAAFHSAIHEFKYRNTHRMVFPIKVNPQRHVIESVAAEEIMGLEVGSKPELMAVMALKSDPEHLLICNGYKDSEYITLALMAAKLGRGTLIIIEQPYELPLILELAEKLGIEAQIGLRMKLTQGGSGRWKSSAGEHSKFGLFPYEVVSCVEQLKASGKIHWLKLLHYHMGSQVTTIESIIHALKEGARMYTELAKQAPSLGFFDVGGGLAVDYDGTKSESDSSMNYSLEEYVRDVVSIIGEACLAAEVPDPVLLTESGRALTSHHAVLITEVLDVTTAPAESDPIPGGHPILGNLQSLNRNLTLANCRETFHDVMEIKEDLLDQFLYGKLSLEERASAEKMSRILLAKIRSCYRQLTPVPEEIEFLEKMLRETYFCNFSLFQSLPDSWAIQQLFPIVPIHRLNETPTHQAVLADLTCDSDGKIDHFIGERGVEHYLLLHEYRGEPYYLAIFLVGAYQEILGGLHHLFGDTNVVHAELGANGQWELSRLVEGDTIEEVLNYVQFNTEKLKTQLYELIESCLQSGRITTADSAQLKKLFKQSLESYTYLVV